jgi:hypothetical protein
LSFVLKKNRKNVRKKKKIERGSGRGEGEGEGVESGEDPYLWRASTLRTAK